MSRAQRSAHVSITNQLCLFRIDFDDVAGLLSTVLRCDPLKLLIQFLTDKNIRPVDLFRLFDKDKQYRVTREQFVSGLKVYATQITLIVLIQIFYLYIFVIL